MQKNGWYKGRSGKPGCFSCHVRNTGIHRGRYIMQKKRKEPIPCSISRCALAAKSVPRPARLSGARWTAPPRPAALAAVSHQLPQVAATRSCSGENL